MRESSPQVSGVLLSSLSSWRCPQAGVLLSSLFSWRCPQVVYPWVHDERWSVHSRRAPCRTTCVVVGAWSLLSIHLFVETTESAPVESFPMLIFSNPLNLSSRIRCWTWQPSFIQRVIATNSLSTVLKSVSDWSDEIHKMGAPEKERCSHL